MDILHLKGQRGKGDRGRIALFLVLFLGAMFLLFQKCLYHDALWNYGYLRSFMLDRDFDLYNEFVLLNSYFMDVPHPNEPIFYTGGCLFMLPFFSLAHLCSGFFGCASDGYSWIYPLITSFASVSAHLIISILLYRLLRKFFDGFSSLIALIAVFFAGNLIFYSFVWTLYTHAFSLLTTTLFILVWLRVRKSGTRINWALWGCLLGIAVWIRPQSVILSVLPLSEGVRLLRKKSIEFKALFANFCIFGLAALACYSPQMMVWIKTEGAPVINAYADIDDEFFWHKPQFLYLFFSPNKGFFIWNPIFIFAVPGFWWLRKRLSPLALPLALIFVLQTYLIACYEFPEGGASFGSRYLIDCTPFFVLCLAAFVRRFRSSKGFKFIIFSVLPMLVVCNIFLLVGYHLELMPHNEYTPTFGELFRILCEAPKKFHEYIFSVHINENVFARPTVHALFSGDGKALGMALLGFAGTCLAMGGFGFAAWNISSGTRTYRRVCLGMVGLSVLVINVFLLSLDAEKEYGGVFPLLKTAYDHREAPPALDVNYFILNRGDSKKKIDVEYDKSIRWVDITSTIGAHEEISIGSLVAKLTIEKKNAPSEVFKLRMHRDTSYSDLGYNSIEVKKADLDRMRNRIVHYWLKADETTGDFMYHNGYCRRFYLDEPDLVRRVTLEFMAEDGSLLVTGIHLAAVKTGAVVK